MITYRRPRAVELSLPTLLDSLGERDRVWLWHNGTDEETLEVVRRFAQDDRVARFHHSRENVRLRTPTTWLWDQSRAKYLSKVDDDCLELPTWLTTLRSAHADNPDLGIVGAWRQYPDEYLHEVVQAKVRRLAGGHRVMENLWVQGSGYLVKRSDVERVGALDASGSFMRWCLRLAKKGRVNGFYFPFLFEDHMDDPRSAHALLRSDADLQACAPLSAARNDVRTLAEWTERRHAEAFRLQYASIDVRDYEGWRRWRRSAVRRARDLLTGRQTAW